MGAGWEGLWERASFLASSTDTVCQAPGLVQLWHLPRPVRLCPPETLLFNLLGVPLVRPTSVASWATPQRSCVHVGPSWGPSTPSCGTTMPDQPGRVGTAGRLCPGNATFCAREPSAGWPEPARSPALGHQGALPPQIPGASALPPLQPQGPYRFSRGPGAASHEEGLHPALRAAALSLHAVPRGPRQRRGPVARPLFLE